MITIVDYGMGNLGSIANMIRRMGGESVIASTPQQVAGAQKLVLPGVGSFDNGMEALNRLGISQALHEAVLKRGVPVLGVCLGMQLLLEKSDEGSLPGLGFLPGRVRRFEVASQGLRVPHMGWNRVELVRQSRLVTAVDQEQRFYFVHSYFVECADEADVTGVSHYGHRFVSMFERGNIMGTQFHPEKSHRFGMALFENFLEI